MRSPPFAKFAEMSINMNLSIPTSFLSELHKRKKRTQRVRSKMGRATAVVISDLPSKKKKTHPKIIAPKEEVSDKEEATVKVDTPVKTDIILEIPTDGSDKKGLLSEIQSSQDIQTEEDLQNYSVPALRKFCSDNGLSKNGRRSQLVQRVLEACKNSEDVEDLSVELEDDCIEECDVDSMDGDE